MRTANVNEEGHCFHEQGSIRSNSNPGFALVSLLLVVYWLFSIVY